jgi:hypothetical protein
MKRGPSFTPIRAAVLFVLTACRGFWRIGAHFGEIQKQNIKYDGELYVDEEVDKLQGLSL